LVNIVWNKLPMSYETLIQALSYLDDNNFEMVSAHLLIKAHHQELCQSRLGKDKALVTQFNCRTYLRPSLQRGFPNRGGYFARGGFLARNNAPTRGGFQVRRGFPFQGFASKAKG
jgi:hypothetical protein